MHGGFGTQRGAAILSFAPGQTMARGGLEPPTPRFSATNNRGPDRRECPANRWVLGRASCASIPVVWGGSGWDPSSVEAAVS